MNNKELTIYFYANMGQFLKLLGEDVRIVEKNIGTGTFGTVHVITERLGDQIQKSALKIELISEEGYTEKQKQTYMKQHLRIVQNEVTIMQQLQLASCPNIVEYRSHIIRPVILNQRTEGYICLLKMELLTNFQDAIHHIELTEQNVIKIAQDIGNGILVAHRKGIIHRDIKPENFFVSNEGIYKLGDFNVSKEAATAHTFAGAPGYIAPEIYRAKAELDENYTHQADLYSFGICLYQFMNDMYFPFEREYRNADDALDVRMSGQKPIPPPCHASKDFAKIILKACAFDTKERYQTIADLLVNLQQLADGEPVIFATKFRENQDTIYSETPARKSDSSTVYAGNHASESVKTPTRDNSLAIVLLMVLSIVCIASVLVLLLKDKDDNDDSANASTTLVEADTTTPEIIIADITEIIPTIEPTEEIIETLPPTEPTENNLITVSDGVYKIASSSNYYMNYFYEDEVQDAKDGVIGLCLEDGSIEQLFKVEHMDSGMYRIQIMHGYGGYLNCWGEPPVQEGMRVGRYLTFSNNETQLFYIKPCEDGTYLIQCVSNANLVVTSEGLWHGAKTYMRQYDPENMLQRWRFEYQ
ncbi:MAG: protein kinase [Oscillospiraceae bacterium]